MAVQRDGWDPEPKKRSFNNITVIIPSAPLLFLLATCPKLSKDSPSPPLFCTVSPLILPSAPAICFTLPFDECALTGAGIESPPFTCSRIAFRGLLRRLNFVSWSSWSTIFSRRKYTCKLHGMNDHRFRRITATRKVVRCLREMFTN